MQAAKAILDFFPPYRVFLRQYRHEQISGPASLERHEQMPSGPTPPVTGKTAVYFENMEKQNLTAGLTAGHMAPAPQLTLSQAAEEEIRKIKEEAMRKHMEERNQYEEQMPSPEYSVIDVNVKGEEDITALHIVSRLGFKSSIVYLLEQGADPLAKTKDGETPAQHAIRNGVKQELIQPLLDVTKEEYPKPSVLPQLEEKAGSVAKNKVSPTLIASVIKGCQGKGSYNMFKVLAKKLSTEEWQQVHDGLINKTNFFENVKQFLKENPTYDQLPSSIRQQVSGDVVAATAATLSELKL